MWLIGVATGIGVASGRKGVWLIGVANRFVATRVGVACFPAAEL